MRVGDSLRIFYPLSAGKPASRWSLTVDGVTAEARPQLAADLLLRSGGADHTLGTLDGTAPAMPGSFHLQTFLAGDFCAQALTPQPGDGIVVQLRYTSGSASFATIETRLVAP